MYRKRNKNKESKETLLPRIPPPPPIQTNNHDNNNNNNNNHSSFLTTMKEGVALGVGSSIGHKIVNNISNYIYGDGATNNNNDKCEALRKKMMEITNDDIYDKEWYNKHCVSR